MDTFFFELVELSFLKSCDIWILETAKGMNNIYINCEYLVDSTPVGRIANALFNQKIFEDKLGAIFDEIIIPSLIPPLSCRFALVICSVE